MEKLVSFNFLLITLLWLTKGNAAPIQLNAESINEAIGTEKPGIVFLCNPYCEFLSLKEKEVWVPTPLIQIEGKANLKFISKEDRLYPLLVSSFPILPYVDNSTSSHQNKEKSEVSKAELKPDYAKFHLDLGWSLTAQGGVFSLKSNSNTQALQAVEPKSLVPAAAIELRFIKGNSYSIFGGWLQHSLNISYSRSIPYGNDQNTIKSTWSQLQGEFDTYLMRPQFKWILRIFQDQVTFKPETDSLTLYGFEKKWIGIGIGLQFKRSQFVLGYPLKATINEKQSFRTGPFEYQGLSLKTRYCSGNLSLFDLEFGICAELRGLYDRQNAYINSNIQSGIQSKIEQTELAALIGIRIGEDLFR